MIICENPQNFGKQTWKRTWEKKLKNLIWHPTEIQAGLTLTFVFHMKIELANHHTVSTSTVSHTDFRWAAHPGKTFYLPKNTDTAFSHLIYLIPSSLTPLATLLGHHRQNMSANQTWFSSSVAGTTQKDLYHLLSAFLHFGECLPFNHICSQCFASLCFV